MYDCIRTHIFFSFFSDLSSIRSHSLSLTLSHTHAHAHAHAHSVVSHSRTLALTHAHTHTHTPSLTHTHHIHRSNSPSSSLTTTTTSSLWWCCRLLRSWRRCGTLLSNGTVEEALLLLHRLENLERAHERLVDVHHCTRVVELSAVVGCREYRHELALSEKLVPILNYLMPSTDQVNVISVQELVDYFGPVGEGNAAVVVAPAEGVVLRVGPEDVAD